jgi:hypothetical protein
MKELHPLLLKACNTINKLNEHNSFYNFRIVRGMCIDRFGNTMFPFLSNEANDVDSYYYDYTRLRTIELISRELISNNIEGEIAELGVFRGQFACILNRLFPAKKLYLFDTFEGFNEYQIKLEQEKGYVSDSFINTINNFCDTNIEMVLNQMENPLNCIIKKGLFPYTTNGLDEKFSLVCIDADFYQSTYDALEYFYPRVVDGGYIFIHDYNDDELFGVQQAVQEYSTNKYRLHKVPLSDHSGTLVISK